jgi:putative transposase
MDDSLRTRAEQLASEIAGQAKTADDLDGLMRLMMKSALERMLNSEMDVHLGRWKLPPIADVEPQLIGKHQRRMPGFDEKILVLYAKGMTTRDIQEIVRELYDVEVSATLISEITADLDAEVTTWRTRPVEALWPIVYFDGVVVHVRVANGRVSQHTVYVALGVNLEGHKQLLGLCLGENE